jgi:uncharacterized protein (TIGR00251 family)
MSCPDRSKVSRQNGNDLLLEIQIQPRASKNEICHLADGSVKIRITSAPVDGKANVQLIEFLAQRLKIAKNCFKIERDHQSRKKCIRIKELGGKQSETLLALGMAARNPENTDQVAGR